MKNTNIIILLEQKTEAHEPKTKLLLKDPLKQTLQHMLQQSTTELTVNIMLTSSKLITANKLDGLYQ